MPVSIRGRSDACLREFEKALGRYETKHPHAEIEIYRHGSVSIRARIIDPDLKGMSRSKRHDKLWKYVEDLPEDCLNQLSVLLPLTPEEKESSFANLEFDNPVPAGW